MAKVALITDTHAGVRNDNPAFHEYQKCCYDWFFNYIDTHSIKHVVHLGDIFDRRKYINFLSAKRCREDLLDPLEDRGIETHIIQGNHDSYYKDTHEVNALDELVVGRYRFINTYSIPDIINIDGLDIQIMPWITQSNRDFAMDVIEHPRAEILMGHLELNGFTMHRGLISDHGLNRQVFDKFDMVFSGHYHHRSTVGNVSYIGAFAEYTWHDYADPRGFSVFDTESRVLEFIQNPYKMFKKVWYNDQYANLMEKIDVSQYKDCILKIIVTQKNNPYYFDRFVDKIEKANPIEIQIVEDHLNLGMEDDEDIVNEAESTIDIFKKYIETSESKGVDKKKIENTILELYHEALNLE